MLEILLFAAAFLSSGIGVVFFLIRHNKLMKSLQTIWNGFSREEKESEECKMQMVNEYHNSGKFTNAILIALALASFIIALVLSKFFHEGEIELNEILLSGIGAIGAVVMFLIIFFSDMKIKRAYSINIYDYPYGRTKREVNRYRRRNGSWYLCIALEVSVLVIVPIYLLVTLIF